MSHASGETGVAGETSAASAAGVTELAWRHATALARAHHHGWTFGDGARACDGAESVEEARKAFGRLVASGADVDGAGQWPALSHVTATGRIAWTVDPNGDVMAEIRRPAGPCMRLSIDTRGACLWVGPSAETRHWRALLTCAQALKCISVHPVLEALQAVEDAFSAEWALASLNRAAPSLHDRWEAALEAAVARGLA